MIAIYSQTITSSNLIISKIQLKFACIWLKKYQVRQIRLSTAEFPEFNCKTELNVTYVWHTLYGRIIVECIIWNHDFMLQKHEIQIPGI